MNINNIIAQIQTHCPSIHSVSGAIKLMEAMENPPQGVTAYVVPTGENSERNSTLNVITQKINASFAVLVMMVYSMNDDTGAQAYADIQAVRDELTNALLGFVPFDGASPIEHTSGSLANISPGVLMWNDEFVTDYYRRNTQ